MATRPQPARAASETAVQPPAGIKPTRAKYNARRAACEQGGVPHAHASLKERTRCYVLHVRQARGEIQRLRRATRYPLVVNGQQVGVWTDDFSYYRADGTFVVEDVKGGVATQTEAYRLRKRLVKACLGIVIQEV